MTTDYVYADGDLLEDRNTYFYTPYGDRAFVAAWRDHRDGVLADLPAPADPPPPRGGGLAPDTGGVRHTGPLLEALLAGLDGGGPEVRALLDRLVQRFEVTKRVHAAYGPDFRAVDKQRYRDLSLYLRLAEVVERAYSVDGGLPYLNVLIKLLDTLSALRGDLEPADAARLARLIGRERDHMMRLADSRGIDLG